MFISGNFEYTLADRQATIVKYVGLPVGALTVPARLDGHPVVAVKGGAFCGCGGVIGVSLPAGVTALGANLFSGCAALKRIDVAADNPVYASLDGALFDRRQRMLVAFPAGFSGKSYTVPQRILRVGERAFSGCAGLISVTLPGSVSAVASDAFTGCASLRNIFVAPENDAFDSVQGVLFDRRQETLVAFPPGWPGEFYTVPHRALRVCDRSFAGCKRLRGVRFQGRVAAIGKRAFAGCDSLRDVELPESLLTIGDGAFARCRALSALTIPKGVTAVGVDVFADCHALERVDVAPGNPAFAAIDGMLLDTRHRTLLLCPARWAETSIAVPPGIEHVAAHAFSGCKRLTTLTFSEGLASIGEWAFFWCGSLESLTLPATLSDIGPGAFIGCSDSLTIEAPEGSFAARYASDNGFAGALGQDWL